MAINHIIKPQVNICLHHTSQDKYTVACTWKCESSRPLHWRKTRRWESQTNDFEATSRKICSAKKWSCLCFEEERDGMIQFGTSRGTFQRFNVKRPCYFEIWRRKMTLADMLNQNSLLKKRNVLKLKFKVMKMMNEDFGELSSKHQLYLIAQMDGYHFCWKKKKRCFAISIWIWMHGTQITHSPIRVNFQRTKHIRRLKKNKMKKSFKTYTRRLLLNSVQYMVHLNVQSSRSN